MCVKLIVPANRVFRFSATRADKTNRQNVTRTAGTKRQKNKETNAERDERKTHATAVNRRGFKGEIGEFADGTCDYATTLSDDASNDDGKKRFVRTDGRNPI